MIISTVSLKGGTGKTTVAINLAVYFAVVKNKSVVIIDTDTNANCISWWNHRKEELDNLSVIHAPVSKKLKDSIDSSEEKYDIVIIDGTPALSNLSGAIMLISDLTIFPIMASPVDFWTFDEIFMPKYEEVKKLNPDFLGVLFMNNVDNRTTLSKEMGEILEDYKLPVFSTYFSDLSIYKDSLAYGKGVVEMKPDRARNEVKSLANEIMNFLR